MPDELDAHGIRTAWLARLLCTQLGLPRDHSAIVVRSARTHDVGKRFLPDGLLDKPGALTPTERAQMERHCILGANRLAKGQTRIEDMPEEAVVALLHHEWWDGQGYPFGLAGDEIPRAARIVAVADVLDALLTARSYKPAWPLDFALDHIWQRRGTQFDPRCAEALMDVASSLPPQWRAMALGRRVRVPARRLASGDAAGRSLSTGVTEAAAGGHSLQSGL